MNWKRILNTSWWIVVPILVTIALSCQWAIRHSPDLSAYFSVLRVGKVNQFDISPLRLSAQPDITGIRFQVRESLADKNMRYLEYSTNYLYKLSKISDEALNSFLQVEGRAAFAGDKTEGKLVELAPDKVYDLFIETSFKTLFAAPLYHLPIFYVISLFLALGISRLRFIVKGRWQRYLTIYSVWIKVTYLVSFTGFFVIACWIDYPLLPILMK